MKFAIYTLGCKVNQYEAVALTELIEENGHTVVLPSEVADVYIVNSCTVTAMSDRKTRQMVRRFKRENPDSIVVLTGCMPQAYPEDAKILAQADIVLGNKSSHKLLRAVAEYTSHKTRILDIEQHQDKDGFAPISISDFSGKTRAFIKIQDGCNRFCSYCIIPTARGRSRSKSISDILSEVKALAGAGYKEVVLTGINLSWYGRDIDESFAHAIHTVASVGGIERIRLSSLEPDFLTKEVIKELSEIPKLCPHFHLSMQSGNDKILKAMNRHYTSTEYFEICNLLFKCFENASITTDFLVGFPGETEGDFGDSLSFVQSVSFSQVHVFPYSIRPNTVASTLPNQLSNTVKQERARNAIKVVEKIQETALQNQVGKTANILIEHMNKDGMYVGYTENYTLVHVPSPSNIVHDIVRVKILEAKVGYCIAEKH